MRPALTVTGGGGALVSKRHRLALFVGAAAYNFLVQPIATEWWTKLWHVWLYLQIAVGIPATIWFTIGALREMKQLFTRLATLKRDDTDNGRVVHHHLAGEADEAGDVEDETET